MAKLEHQSRLSISDPTAQSMEKLSLDTAAPAYIEDFGEGPRSGSEEYFTRPSFSRFPLSSQSLSYPEIATPAANSQATVLAHHVQNSPVENTHVSPMDDEYGESISPGTKHPGFLPRASSTDSIPPSNYWGVTQNFDDLLTDHDQEIIYPVYSFRASVESQWSYGSSPSIDPLSKDQNSGRSVNYFSGHTPEESLKALPNATHGRKSFKVLHPQDMDFDARLFSYIINLGPAISAGKADLQSIRQLYHVWLGHFICKAYSSGIMFSCLTNLTTNYIVTNALRGGRKDPNDSTKNLSKTLLIHSIKHYAVVIKSLRSLLNENSDPHLASSVSYILSIMSIYDPAATVDSTVCFRDGMFSVLSYSLLVSKSNGVAPPPFVPIHMKLAANIVRTVYLPPYSTNFLREYEVMLRRLGKLISSIEPTEISNLPTFEFVVEVFEDLLEFCQESIQVHIPAVNANLNNLPVQLDILFRMFRKWANLGPSRLLTVSRSTDPLEKVMNLFFRLLRKALYAVVPQVKFFFLRDFDSPLMLDVIPSCCDASVIASLDSPDKLCLAPDAYSRVLPELKLLSAYAIRVNTFLNMRISILYRNLVYNEKVRELYPIDNIVYWKKSITDIHATRTEFQQRIGLQEKCIENFNSTYITQVHYPKIQEPGSCDQTVQETEETSVDLLTMKEYGLLEKDELPAMN